MENKRSVTVVAALVREGDKFLIGQRPEGKARAGMWEFIGGKTEPNETNEEALIRECREEIGVTVEVGPLFVDVLHDYPDLFVHRFVYNAKIPEGAPQRLEHEHFSWISPVVFVDVVFCPADVDVLAKIKAEFPAGGAN